MAHLIQMTEGATLALHAAGILAASRGGAMSAREVAKRLGASKAHLHKVFQRLRKMGVAEAELGRSGGFRLARPPERISVREVCEAIDGPFDLASCPFHVPPCRRECAVGREFIRKNREMVRFLARTTLASVRAFTSSAGRRDRRRR
ncbi:MAG: RrF2 family transcriptional regulator [Planctomycetota bacterium]